jgi:large subunit ribosomal protein L7/L12
MKELKELAEKLANLKLKEVTSLKEILKEEYGIEPAAVAAPVMVAAEGGATEKAEEKSIFDVVLVDAGSSKIGVIKVVKNILGLGLKEAKELVDGAPQAIKEGVPKEEAESLQKQFADAGAKVELK